MAFELGSLENYHVQKWGQQTAIGWKQARSGDRTFQRKSEVAQC